MNQDLRQRIPIGVIYVLVIAGSFLGSTQSSLVLIGLFFLLSLWEFSSIEIQNSLEKGIIILINALIVGSTFLLDYSLPYFRLLALIISVLFLLNGWHLFSKKKSFLTLLHKWIRPIILLSIPFLFCVKGLQDFYNFRYVILGSFIIIWLNDAGAYFVGKAFGKRKILPEVSPGKSWEGWIGGLLVGAIASIIIAQFYKVIGLNYWLLLSVVLPITGLLGDLTESSWKRRHNIKDSGTILRGHGGFLDRLDSFIYSLPFIYLLFVVLC